MRSILLFYEKGKRKIRGMWLKKMLTKRVYFYLYPSYWHFLLFKKKKGTRNVPQYFAAKPHPGAGIGHQMANWITGFWFAKQFNLFFAHIPFSSSKWEEFLGFGINEKTIPELKKEGYRIIRLPQFLEDDQCEIIENIISSYAGKKIIFLAEQDQGYHKQFHLVKELQKKFYSAPARKNDSLIYDSKNYNIAIHIRRGDIIQKQGERINPNLTMRFQKNDYFKQALQTAINFLGKPEAHIYLFSQGEIEDFKEFAMFQNIHYCLDMEECNSFLHMVYADALITSKSSFSYNPALLNRGIKFCPLNFWHGYPNREDWVLLDENGRIVR